MHLKASFAGTSPRFVRKTRKGVTCKGRRNSTLKTRKRLLKQIMNPSKDDTPPGEHELDFFLFAELWSWHVSRPSHVHGPSHKATSCVHQSTSLAPGHSSRRRGRGPTVAHRRRTWRTGACVGLRGDARDGLKVWRKSGP